jgi:2-polyprenyl-3-methyl-5-hydroxy-6-metoxy-1,4-benzoquinol methylase
MDYEKVEKRFYEKLWMDVGDWKREAWTHEKGPFRRKKPDIEGYKVLKFLKKELKKGRVLDLGCGGGRNSVLLAENGFEAYGVDISKHAIKLAKLLAKEKKAKAEFKVGSVLDLAYKDGFFDAVMDFGCLHHLRKSQWKKYLKSILRVLKTGGYYLLYTFSVETGKTWHYNPRTRRNWYVTKINKHYYHYFSKKEIREFFNKRFKILRIETIKYKGRTLVFYLSFMRKI